MEKIWSRSPNERPISVGFEAGLGVTQREATVDPSFGIWTGHLKGCLSYVNYRCTNGKVSFANSIFAPSQKFSNGRFPDGYAEQMQNTPSGGVGLGPAWTAWREEPGPWGCSPECVGATLCDRTGARFRSRCTFQKSAGVTKSRSPSQPITEHVSCQRKHFAFGKKKTAVAHK